jgi:AcrR family transcriptional regulator
MRRDQIVAAALRCFAREGFHATTMQHVIRESGLSAGAVYRYFPSKNALVVAGASGVMAGARDVLARMAERPEQVRPEDVVADLLESVLASVGDGPDMTRVAVSVWAEALRDEELARLAGEMYGDVRGQLEALSRGWVETGVLAPGTDPVAVSRTLFALVPGFVLQRLLLGGVTPEDLRQGLLALLHTASAPAPAPAEQRSDPVSPRP